MLSVVSAGGINAFAIGEDKENFVAEEGKKEKSYVVVTENQKTAEQIEEVFATENEMIANSNAQESDLNSSYLGEGTFEEQVESIENTMTENSTVTVELSANELEQVESSDNVVCVEEDFVINANAFKKDRKVKEGKKEEQVNKKRELLEQYAKAKKEISENVEPDWNMKAIDAGNVVKYRANPRKEKNIKFEKGLQKKEVDTYIESTDKVRVAVLDSGVDIVEGLELAETINLVPEDQEITMMYQDMTGHGTAIASVIAGNNENGIQGVNDNVELCSVKVLDKNNQAPLSRIVEGIYWCIDNDINIINMSFGTSKKSVALEKAVKDAYAAGILMIAAAGNGGEEDAVEYPAAFEEVMAVASTNEMAEISDFSNTGEELDVAAPGEKIPVTGFFGLSGITHGTSIATPHVTGVASLLWEKDLTKSHDFIRQLIEYSAKQIDGTDECGLLDADSAMANYEQFAETFEVLDNAGVDTNDVVAEAALEASVEENTEEPDTFEYVSDDEAYVEGRWGGGIEAGKEGHVDCIEAYSKLNEQFSAKQIALLKEGCVAPDKEKYGFKKDSDKEIHHPQWHGWFRHKWQTTNKCNYIGAVEVISRVALKGGDSSTITNKRGLTKVMFDDLISEVSQSKFGAEKWSKILSTNNAENRKYFLWGAAIHSLTDSCAHSSAGKINGSYKFINHKNTTGSTKYTKDADNPTYFPGRFTLAKALAKEVLFNLNNDLYIDYIDYYYALKSVNYNTNDKNYKLLDLYQYAKDNAKAGGSFASFADSIIKSASIDSSSLNIKKGE